VQQLLDVGPMSVVNRNGAASLLLLLLPFVAGIRTQCAQTIMQIDCCWRDNRFIY
jgi:hypothetical protein